MSWLASYRALHGARRLRAARFSAAMVQGSLLMELGAPATAGGESDLRAEPAGVGRAGAWQFTLERDGEGRLRLSAGRPGAAVLFRLEGCDLRGDEVLRLCWSWDCRARRSLLTAEVLASGQLHQVETTWTDPVPGAALEALLAARAVTRGQALHWLAVADHVHRPGPMPGLAPDLRVETAGGARPVAAIRPGDRVLTAAGGLVPVLWSGSRVVPALGRLAPLSLEPAQFGCARTLLVAPHQRLRVEGAEVEYWLGRDQGVAEARHLVEAAAGDPVARGGLCTWHGLVLERAELILAEGLAVETLHLGSLARHPEIAATTVFADLAASGRMPLHREADRPAGCALMRPHEARGVAGLRRMAQAPRVA